MFEVGKDILKHGISATQNDATTRRRLNFIYFAFLFAFVLFGARTLQLGIQGTEKTRNMGANGQWLVERADIVDRNGDILAKNVMSGSVQLINKFVQDKDREEIAHLIHELFPYKYSLSDALKLVRPERGYVLLAKNASENQIKKVKEAKLVGLEVDQKQIRIYPKRRLFSHVVGFVVPS